MEVKKKKDNARTPTQKQTVRPASSGERNRTQRKAARQRRCRPRHTGHGEPVLAIWPSTKMGKRLGEAPLAIGHTHDTLGESGRCEQRIAAAPQEVSPGKKTSVLVRNLRS